MRTISIALLFALVIAGCQSQSQSSGEFKLNELGYFENGAVNVMVFQDIYPEGHQGGVAFIQHGRRVATNGDLRLEATPGQWQPLPKPGTRVVDTLNHLITMEMSFPDSAQHLRGFNPLRYPDLQLKYKISVHPEGQSFIVKVDLDQPLPKEFVGKVGFNLEFFPGWLFGKTWQMDGQYGIFPRQANGPSELDENGVAQAIALATGKQLVVVPENDLQRVKIETKTGELELLDGRVQHNNGWFVVRQTVAEGATTNAIEWVITPNSVQGWKADPVIHLSQVGYHPNQDKVAVIELDKNDKSRKTATLFRIDGEGNPKSVLSQSPSEWGRFLRYDNLQFDFSSVKDEGMYYVQYGDIQSNPFKIGADVYKRHVWQPVLEYFLPVQMCHMRVNEKYRVWHDLCHMDDALMAPTNYNHIDGYVQGPSTLTKYQPNDHVPGLNIGGWHDAGDFDLRVESQAGECYIMALAYEEFNVQYDNTTIDQTTRIVEINLPDGKPDILQQIEHGALSVVGGYKALGRLYRGIITPTVRQYVLLGDASAMSDGVIKGTKAVDFYDAVSEENPLGQPWDDRYVFTEQNRNREITTAQNLAASARALRGFNDPLADDCLKIAEALFAQPDYPPVGNRPQRPVNKVGAAIELFLTTGKDEYKNYLLENKESVIRGITGNAWVIARALPKINDAQFTADVTAAVKEYSARVEAQAAETPYGVPYRPSIWGAGWDIQRFGMQHYFLATGYPDIFNKNVMLNALNFVLGAHPGENTASFASGVGSRSAIVGYGLNRADWSYIPGGVISGTALIRPDFAELMEFPYLWQQIEYVLGGGSGNYMFLVLAADKLLNQ